MLHILFVVLAFHFFWPLGLAALAFFIYRRRQWRRMAFAGGPEASSWNPGDGRFEHRMARAQEKVSRAVAKAERYCGGRGWSMTPTSGNHAFDDYRQETMKRLEVEQTEFHDFLSRLRAAKDRSEFDAFMADRRRREAEPPHAPPPPAPQS